MRSAAPSATSGRFIVSSVLSVVGETLRRKHERRV
jgi:hypothetical protein